MRVFSFTYANTITAKTLKVQIGGKEEGESHLMQGSGL